MRYAIDLPDPHRPDGECVTHGYYATRKEATEDTEESKNEY
jgi:hypothetical protein